MVAVEDHLDALFHALADSTRRRMLERLRGGALAVGELAAEFPMSRPAISKHLAVLDEAGLVTAEKVGRRRVYRAILESLDAARAWLDGQRKPTTDRDLPTVRPRPAAETEAHVTPGGRSERAAEASEGWRVW